MFILECYSFEKMWMTHTHRMRSNHCIFIVFHWNVNCVRVLIDLYKLDKVRSINVKYTVSRSWRECERASETTRKERRHSFDTVVAFVEKVNSKPFHWVPVLSVLSFICATHCISRIAPHWLAGWLTGWKQQGDRIHFHHTAHRFGTTHRILCFLLGHKNNCISFSFFLCPFILPQSLFPVEIDWRHLRTYTWVWRCTASTSHESSNIVSIPFAKSSCSKVSAPFVMMSEANWVRNEMFSAALSENCVKRTTHEIFWHSNGFFLFVKYTRKMARFTVKNNND